MSEIIKLAPIKTGIAEYRERKGFFPKVVKAMTSLKTTAVLGATLGTLLTAGALAPAATGAALRSAPVVVGKGALAVGKKVMPKTLMGGVKTVAGAGIVAGLGVSGIKKVTKGVFETGKKGGEILGGKTTIKEAIGVEEGDKLLTKENILKAGKAAGIIGAGALGVAGVAEIIKKVKEKKTTAQKLEDTGLKNLGFTDPQPVGLGGIPIATAQPSQITPSGAPQSTNGARPISNIIQISVR